MKVRIKKNHNFPLSYQTEGACAFDFCALSDVRFAPREWKLVETGTVIETPKGYSLMIVPRSSIFKNYGLIQVNSVGIIDQDYSGDNDTIKFAYYNMRDEEVEIRAGERIGQGMFVAIARPEFIEVTSMDNENRGGFGSTGKV